MTELAPRNKSVKTYREEDDDEVDALSDDSYGEKENTKTTNKKSNKKQKLNEDAAKPGEVSDKVVTAKINEIKKMTIREIKKVGKQSLSSY
jgi:hypothetical protein